MTDPGSRAATPSPAGTARSGSVMHRAHAVRHAEDVQPGVRHDARPPVRPGMGEERRDGVRLNAGEGRTPAWRERLVEDPASVRRVRQQAQRGTA